MSHYDPSSSQFFPDSYAEEPPPLEGLIAMGRAALLRDRIVTEAEYQRWIQDGLAKAKARKEGRP